jgi:hypothetical protein
MRKELKSSDLSDDQTFRRILVQTFNPFFPHPSLILRCEAYHKGALTIELKGISFQKESTANWLVYTK